MGKNKYFDEWEFMRAQENRFKNPYEAIAKFEKYIQEYPEDYSAQVFYANNLITIGRRKEAEKIIADVERKLKEDVKFSVKEAYKMEAVEFDILYNRIRLLSYGKRYKELYELLQNNRKKLEHLNLGDLSFFCRKKLGMLKSDKRAANSYLFRQIVEYRDEDLFEHIKKHMADYNADLEEPNKYIFNSDFPLKKVFEEIKKYIPSDKKMCGGFFENVYIFKYDGCGRTNDKISNYFKVVTFDDSQDFITICPIPASECEGVPYVDLDYMIDYSSSKVKRVSAMEKFNKKFKR
jgi:tetratricopeptide (TPR) repeat protein